MNVTISKTISVDYGHTLPAHYSWCNQIHGHRATVIAVVKGEINTTKGDSSEGMVMDFKFLKEIMMEKIHGVLDHGFAIWKNDDTTVKILPAKRSIRTHKGEIHPSIQGKDLVEIYTYDLILNRNEKVLITDEPPTAETLAKWAYNQIVTDLPENVTLEKVEWYETPNSVAVYSNEGNR